MATQRRRLCTSGRGARLRLGTFAPGGSTSSPLWVWGTPLRLSGLFLVRRQSILFASKPLLTYVFSPGWLNTHVLSPWHPVRVTGRSCVSEVMSATCHACNGIPWVPCDTTFKLAVMHFSWWSSSVQAASRYVMIWWSWIFGEALLLLSSRTMQASDSPNVLKVTVSLILSVWSVKSRSWGADSSVSGHNMNL